MTTIIEVQDIIQNLTKAKITQINIAEALGCGRSNISLRTKNKSQLSFEEIKKIEKHFNISLSTQQIVNNSDIIKIPYWENIPEEMKRSDYPYVVILKQSLNDWNKGADNLRIITMNGDRLENYWYKIRHNDVLIIDTAENKINTNGSGLYFATSRNNTMFWVREMQILYDGNIEFHSYSPSGLVTKVISMEELEKVDFKVIGKVIKNESLTL